MIALDRDPAALGFTTPTGARSSRRRTKRIAQSPRPRPSTASSRPALTGRLRSPRALPSGSAFRIRSTVRPQASPSRSRSSGSGLPKPACPSPAGKSSRAPRDFATDCCSFSWVVKAPDRQGQKGLALVRPEDELPAAIGRAIAESRSGVAIVEELVEGPEVTVNAFSVGGRVRSADRDRPADRRSARLRRRARPRLAEQGRRRGGRPGSAVSSGGSRHNRTGRPTHSYASVPTARR